MIRLAFARPPTIRFASTLLPTPPPFTEAPHHEDSPDESQQVHCWVDKFKTVDAAEALRKAKGITTTFSRSSGPGGQNVNKVNTKATVRCALDAPWIPAWAKSALMQNPHYAPSSNSLLVTSTTSRSQAQNINDCLEKLHKIILASSTSNLQNPTSAFTKNRVQAHLRADRARRRAEKERRSSVKQGRRAGGGWD